MEKYKPTYMIESVAKIPFVLLERDNIKGLLLDVDNTLITIGKGITKECYEWVKEAKKLGYKICILSNSINMRKIKKIMNDMQVFGLGFARKPNVKGFEMALDILGLKKEEVIMIGDQIFTDIVGANRFKIKSILVKPLDWREEPITMVKRPFERIILKKIKMEERK